MIVEINPQEKFSLVLIKWVDAESANDWEGSDRVSIWGEKDTIIYEVGWLVSENKKYVVICSQIARDNDLGNRTKIPKKWIVSRLKLKQINKRENHAKNKVGRNKRNKTRSS